MVDAPPRFCCLYRKRDSGQGRLYSRMVDAPPRSTLIGHTTLGLRPLIHENVSRPRPFPAPLVFRYPSDPTAENVVFLDLHAVLIPAVWGLWFEFGVWGSGFLLLDLRAVLIPAVWGSRFRVWGLGFCASSFIHNVSTSLPWICDLYARKSTPGLGMGACNHFSA